MLTNLPINYPLPIVKTSPMVRLQLYSEVNLGGFGDIGAILARRINMGYSTIEEDCVSVKSYSSVRSVAAV